MKTFAEVAGETSSEGSVVNLHITSKITLQDFFRSLFVSVNKVIA